MTVRTFATPAEAVIAKSFLEAHGLFVLIPDFYHAANAWHLVTALQGVRLCTFEDAAHDARRLLSTGDQAAAPKGRIAIRDIVLAAVIYFFAGIPHPIRRR